MARAMDDLDFPGWQPAKSVEVVEGNGLTQVLVKGQPYMRWQSGDEGCTRLAIVQLYKCGLGTEEDLAAAFGRHINSVQNYLRDFAGEGIQGLMTERRGPKGQWKLTPELRGKILHIVLREGIWKLEAIQQRLLEAWQEAVTLRRFTDREIDYAARHLCEDLNRMQAVTLDKFHLPIRYHVQ